MKRLVVIAWIVLFTGAAWADRYEAEALLDLAAADSRDATWATNEGRDEDSLRYRKRSLELTEQAYSVRGDASAAGYFALLAERAFNAEELDKAEDYANSALEFAATAEGPPVFAIGDAVHHGHLVLGRLALRQDDVETATMHLLEAGKTPGSPVLGSFGPNMTLARHLLKRGEREVVLEYFGLCRNFWKMGVEDGRLDRWSLVVTNGGIPEFRANLVYGY